MKDTNLLNNPLDVYKKEATNGDDVKATKKGHAKEDRRKDEEKFLHADSLSDISISTVSNSTGIDSDLYMNVIRKIKKEKRQRRRERERERKNTRKRKRGSRSRSRTRSSSRSARSGKEDQREHQQVLVDEMDEHEVGTQKEQKVNQKEEQKVGKCKERENDSKEDITKRDKREDRKESKREREGVSEGDHKKEHRKDGRKDSYGEQRKNDDQAEDRKKRKKKESTHENRSNEDKRTKRKRSSKESYDSDRRHRKQKDADRKKKHKRSRSRTRSSYDEPIPKDPFNPLLLAYEKKKKHRHKKMSDEGSIASDRWRHDRYESTSGEEPVALREARPNKSDPKVDLQHVRKNLWKSKAGVREESE
ncbi:hypothetical protein C922_01852 [Plasmodium inui San Antonio 1]|uniref:Uncharacterized protein n=1 Tax=Plasmodium inui San Antonio 1 TaxID=1237626 RepID=W7A359_9APIC|nr:hypothetical protein C922_01852 [Plasmodium inui San Antonio 1]EUD67667.1 hypothetical protein C922_01852 [Plasmodium inui San Antonio 1]